MDAEMIKEVVIRLSESYFDLFNLIGDKIYIFYLDYSRPILNVINTIFRSSFNVFLLITTILALFFVAMSIYVSVKRRKEKKFILEAGEEPTVTIQIPTYNELAALNCARRCLNFDYPKEKMQIIIGDDSSDKEVSLKINEFAKEYDGRILVTRRGKNIGFKPGNLNHMLKYTTGEIIVIFDSDFLPEKDFLKRIVAPYTKTDVSVVQARWKIDNYDQNIYSILGGTISFLCHQITLPFMSSFGGNTFLCGSAESIRRKDLLEVGGWKSGSLTEDIECSLRLHKAGKTLMYMPDLTCKCEAPYNFRDLCKQQMRWAYGVIAAVKEHFTGIFLSRKVSLKNKFSVGIFASGYGFSWLIVILSILGFLAVITEEPAAIDWPKFISETLRNIAWTAGVLIASVFALYHEKKIKDVHKVVLGSLSIGLAVVVYVNIGIYKAITGRPMQWFILDKIGNKVEK
jgi:cellulose synthase/poly-beta-1,6-N-acetylglucosamine synthase-like glycosyltransferase